MVPIPHVACPADGWFPLVANVTWVADRDDEERVGLTRGEATCPWCRRVYGFRVSPMFGPLLRAAAAVGVDARESEDLAVGLLRLELDVAAEAAADLIGGDA